MPKRADIFLDQSANTGNGLGIGAPTQYLVQTPTGVLYHVYIDFASDVSFKKSSDGGLNWSNPTIVYAGTVTGLSIWYDRWSDISAGLIHLAYTHTTSHDTFYRTINTESSDALSTETTIFAGTSAVAAGSSLSICRARGGNVYCRTCIDAGAEGGFFRLPNANVPNGAWDAARTINEALATLDMAILLPGWAADNQDMMLIFWDVSANEISRQLYDDSANSWAETSISGSMVDVTPSLGGFPHFSAAVDIANSRNILIAWNGVDTANADLLGWTVTESAITAFTTSVVLNGTDDQGLCAITIDLQTGYWWAFYAGKSDGSETWGTAVNIYYKYSTDSGATWSAENLLTLAAYNVFSLHSCPRLYLGSPPVLRGVNVATFNYPQTINIQVALPTAKYQLGI